MNHYIRLAEPTDIQDILNIYSEYVKNSVVSFETNVPSLEDFEERIRHIQTKYPVLVYVENKDVQGFCYADKHRVRSAYKWSVDVAIYLNFSVRGKGNGKILYKALLAILREQGFFNAYAGITLPNPASIGLHEALGFKKVGIYEEVGYKLNDWHSVGWWGLKLQEKQTPPKSTISIHRIEQEKLDEILADMDTDIE